MNLLSSLSAEQDEVVKYSGNALLTACPGSGKTRTVAAKIAYRIIRREPADRRWILAITHTRVAAEEIHERIDRAGIELDQVWIGTIHSFCLEWILRPYAGEHSRISKGFRLINEHEQRLLIREIKALVGLTGWADFPTEVDDSLEVPIHLVGKDRDAALIYHQRLRSEKLLDFDLILSLAERLLKSNVLIGSRLSSLFGLVLVDEYQDLSRQQYEIISAISRHGSSEFLLVGDADQAIYTTLGAVVKDLDGLKSQLGLSDMREFHLSGCYRSTQKIIDFYRRYQEVPFDIESRLLPRELETGVTYRRDVQLRDLAEHVAGLIEFHTKNGTAPSEIVILSPQWPDAATLGRQIQQLLPRIRIDSPNSSPLPRSFENRWHSFIRLLTTPADGASYSRRRRIAQSVVDDLVGMGFALSSSADVVRWILLAANSVRRPGAESMVDYVSDSIRQFCSIVGLDFDSSEAAASDLTSYTIALQSRIEYMNLEDVAQSILAYREFRAGPRVTSYHSTKGEEFDVVIATGLVVGKLPNWNDVRNRPQGHTDYVTRRLLYVAASRARHHLHLISEIGHKTAAGYGLVPTPQIAWKPEDA